MAQLRAMWLSQETLQQICASCDPAVTTVKLTKSAKRGKSNFTWKAWPENKLGSALVLCIAQLSLLRASQAYPTPTAPATLSRPRARGQG